MPWNEDEMNYCRNLVRDRGDTSVGFEPSIVASYLRLQACAAFRKGAFQSAARLGHAATMINWSADNKHTPNWDAALWAFDVELADTEARP